jgi:hypothetical protein
MQSRLELAVAALAIGLVSFTAGTRAQGRLGIQPGGRPLHNALGRLGSSAL